MELVLHISNQEKIAKVMSQEVVIAQAQEALELLMNCSYNLGTTKLIVQESNLSKDFFDLKTGLAGEILQKFSTYNGHLAIIGDYSQLSSKSLKDFIYESNRFGRINFVSNEEEAIKVLTR